MALFCLGVWQGGGVGPLNSNERNHLCNEVLVGLWDGMAHENFGRLFLENL